MIFSYIRGVLKNTNLNEEVGMVIDVDDLNGKVVEFSNGNQSWEYESDILEVGDVRRYYDNC